jgi:hypothetical protein
LRTSPAPPVVPAHFGDDAPLVGAAEEAVRALLSDDGISRWTAAKGTSNSGRNDLPERDRSGSAGQADAG